MRNAKETTHRAAQAQQTIEQMGGHMDVYWTIGRYDVVALIEAPDDETVTAVLLRTAGAGNVRSETLRAFTADEMTGILQKLG